MPHEFPPPKQPWTEVRLSAVLWVINFPEFPDPKKFQLIGLETHVCTASSLQSMVSTIFDGFRVNVRYLCRRPREPTALSGVFSLLPGSYMTGISPFFRSKSKWVRVEA